MYILIILSKQKSSYVPFQANEEGKLIKAITYMHMHSGIWTHFQTETKPHLFLSKVIKSCSYQTEVGFNFSYKLSDSVYII